MSKLEARFSSKIEFGENCWRWLGGYSRSGYGKLEVAGKTVRAHRLSYELFVGEIPDKQMVCHSCDNPACVRPDHLFIGTGQDNTNDKVRKGRQAKGDQHYARKRPELLPRGDSHGMTKLSDAQVIEIRQRYTGKRGQIVGFAREFGVSQNLIFKIVHNQVRLAPQQTS